MRKSLIFLVAIFSGVSAFAVSRSQINSIDFKSEGGQAKLVLSYSGMENLEQSNRALGCK